MLARKPTPPQFLGSRIPATANARTHTLVTKVQLRGIRIENFRGIKSAEVKRLKRLNIVTGTNGGGKTSLLAAVFLNCGASSAGLLLSIAASAGAAIPQPFRDADSSSQRIIK
jgi:hypothetical protein